MLNASHRLNARGDEHVHVPLDLCALGLGLAQRDLRLQPGQLQRDLLGDWELVTAHHAVHGLSEQEAHTSTGSPGISLVLLNSRFWKMNLLSLAPAGFLCPYIGSLPGV